jgi:hypothetical protein
MARPRILAFVMVGGMREWHLPTEHRMGANDSTVPESRCLGLRHLYIRNGNSTRRLISKETVDYCKTRWK